MKKKAFAAIAIAGFLALSGSSAASAADYPAEITCTASPATVAVGGTSTIACEGVTPGGSRFEVSGPGVVDGTLSSLVFAAASGSTSVDKIVDNDGSVSATFTAPAVGSYTIMVTDGNAYEGEATVAVTASGTTDGSLPVTGGAVPIAAVWLGAGALGIGAIAVTAGVARRNARQQS